MSPCFSLHTIVSQKAVSMCNVTPQLILKYVSYYTAFHFLWAICQLLAWLIITRKSDLFIQYMYSPCKKNIKAVIKFKLVEQPAQASDWLFLGSNTLQLWFFNNFDFYFSFWLWPSNLVISIGLWFFQLIKLSNICLDYQWVNEKLKM